MLALTFASIAGVSAQDAFVSFPKVYTSNDPQNAPLGTLVGDINAWNSYFEWEQFVVVSPNDPVDGIRLTFLENYLGRLSATSDYNGYPMVALSGLEILDMNGRKIPITPDLLSTNSLELSEGSLEYLLDDDYETFYHSIWKDGVMSPVGYVYIDVKFPEGVELNMFTIKTYSRLNKSLVPSKVALTRYGVHYDPMIAAENTYNITGATRITDESQLKDGGVYIIRGNRFTDYKEDILPRFYSGITPTTANIDAALNASCVYMFKKTANGWNIISLSNAQYWALNKNVRNVEIDWDSEDYITSTTWSTGMTVFPELAAEIKVVKSGNLEDAFVLYSDIDDNEVQASWHWVNPNDDSDVINIEPGIVNANKFVFMDKSEGLVGCPCVSEKPGEFTYGYDVISVHPHFEDFLYSGYYFDAGGYLCFNPTNGEGEWNIYEVSMDDPYYLWANAVPARVESLRLIRGEDPGCISGDISALEEAIEAVEAVVENKDKAGAQEAVEAFVESVGLAGNAGRVKIENGCYYAIESAYPGFYDKQGKIKAVYATESGLSWKDAPASYKDNPEFVFQFQFYDGNNETGIFAADSEFFGKVFKIYNESMSEWNGGYVGYGNTSEQVNMTGYWGSSELVVEPMEADIYTMYVIGHYTYPLHAQGHQDGAGSEGAVVYWMGGVGTPSSWRLKLVKDFNPDDSAPVEKPLKVDSYVPSQAVSSLNTITITFSDEIVGIYDDMETNRIYLGSENNSASFEVNGKELTINLLDAITTPGDYGLVIPEGLITRKSNGEAITMDNEIVFTVEAAGVTGAFDWCGTWTVRVGDMETFNGGVCPAMFTMTIADYYGSKIITEFLGNDISNLNYGGIVLNVADDGRSAKMSTNGYVGGSYPDYLKVCDVESSNIPIPFTANADGTISIGDFLLANYNWDNQGLTPLVYCYNVTATKGSAVYENTIEIADVTASAGEQVTLSFNMKNAFEISCFQCDLYLPEGFNVATDDYGNRLINVSHKRTTPDGHQCSFSELPDGGIRILLYSTNEATFAGNEGEVLTVTVDIDREVVNGDYTVELRNIEMTQPDETYYITKLTTSTIDVYTAILGDLTGDNLHTIADVQEIVNLILANACADEYPMADVNGDNRISVTDLQAIVNLVLHQSNSGATHRAAMRAKRSAESGNSLYVEPFSIRAGEEKQVLVKLDNPGDAFSALQFDLYLPAGIEIATGSNAVAIGSRTDESNHNRPMYAYQDDGALRVLCYSNKGSEFVSASGDVIAITLTAADGLAAGEYSLEIRNVELARRDATADRPANTTTRVMVDSWTGINGVLSDGDDVKVYDIYGRKVRKTDAKGIYIVNGKKVLNK